MRDHLRILVLTKRHYTNKDLIEDRFGRVREIPLHMSRNGHSIFGLCLSYRKGEDRLVQDEGVRWKSISAWPLFAGGLSKFVAQAARRTSRADLIWACSDSLYGIIACGLARIFKIPVVFDLYDNFEAFFLGRLPLFRQLYRRAVCESDAVTVASRPLFDLVLSYGRKKPVHIIENAVDTALFKPLDKKACRIALRLPADAIILGTAGSLFRNRAVAVLYDAFKILAKQHSSLYLAVAGPRDEPPPAHPRLMDLGTLSYKKVPEFLNALDVGVICNRQGDFGSYCFPQKAREMMACEVPIVAANVGSMKNLFIDNPQWLFQPKNPLHLAATIEKRLRNPNTDYGSIPTWSNLAEEVEFVFYQALKNRRRCDSQDRRC